MGILKYHRIIILSFLFLVLSCKAKKSLRKWQGLGEGDSYLVIQDSILTFNGPDYFITELKIKSISKDSIYCRYFDSVTGELRTSKQFAYAKSLDEVSTKFDSSILHFTNINRPKLLSRNHIESIAYEIFDYNENLFRKYLLKENGNMVVLDENLKEIKSSKNINKIESIFKKLSILDLDEFVWSEKNFCMISHAPCHCLEINYNQKKKLRYCRQEHNYYINGILKEIKTITE